MGTHSYLGDLFNVCYESYSIVRKALPHNRRASLSVIDTPSHQALTTPRGAHVFISKGHLLVVPEPSEGQSLT